MAITPAQYDLLVSPAILQEALLDKDTGLAMAAGVVTFYQDAQRQTLKNVYYQTNAAGSYQYIPIPNPNTLTANGCLADPGGNAILPFYFPWDETNDTIPQAYYVTVVNAQNIPQFTLQNFPFMEGEASDDETGQQNLLNFMPNPQFTAHNNLPGNLYPNGTAAVTVAPGGSLGWYFQKPTGSDNIDDISFVHVVPQPNGLTGDPQYAIDIHCVSITTEDAYKELRVRFDNVNRFASLSQFYTLGFYAKNNNAGNVIVNVNLFKYFGSGGAGSTTAPIAQFSVGSAAFNVYSISFLFGENNVLIGPSGDDYFELVFGMPVDTTFDIEMTDFFLIPGIINVTSFPQRPDHEVFATGIAGSMPTPDPNGGDNYLPVIYTPTGFNFDASAIGNITASLAATTPAGYLPFDGSTYFTNQYNAVTGIPYSRLGSFLYANSSGGIPMFGTGTDFVTGYISTADTAGNIYISDNQPEVGTPPTTGTTTFTPVTQFVGQSAAYAFNAFRADSNAIFIRSTSVISSGSTNITGPANGSPSAGFTYSNVTLAPGTEAAFYVTGIGAASTLAVSGANPAKNFTFRLQSSSQEYYVWYRTRTTTPETDPAPGGTGIMVQIIAATDTAADVAYKTVIALQAAWLSRMIATNGLSLKTSSTALYWLFSANSVNYYVWYQTGTENDPLVASTTGIEVKILSADTVTEVATKTIAAINQFSFGVPSGGLFLRGVDPNSIYDAGTRSGLGNNNSYGVGPGTFETDYFASHDHLSTGTFTGATTGMISVAAYNNTDTTFTGQGETRPVNLSVNWMIKY